MAFIILVLFRFTKEKENERESRYEFNMTYLEA